MFPAKKNAVVHAVSTVLVLGCGSRREVGIAYSVARNKNGYVICVVSSLSGNPHERISSAMQRSTPGLLSEDDSLSTF